MKSLLPLVELAVYPVPVWLTSVLEVRSRSGDDHLQEDVEDCVEGLRVPVPVGNTQNMNHIYAGQFLTFAD